MEVGSNRIPPTGSVCCTLFVARTPKEVARELMPRWCYDWSSEIDILKRMGIRFELVGWDGKKGEAERVV
jgi:hypothetical protein